MILLHSPLSWHVVQHAVAPLTALVLLTAATVPESPAPEPAADPATGDPAVTLEAAAVELAHELRAVPADDTDRLCAHDDLRVSWTEPTGFDHGAHVGTIGPAPDADTAAVSGVVVCGASTWAYMGFEAQRVDAEWRVTAVPYLEESHGDVASLNLDADPGERATAARPATAPAPSPSTPTAHVAQSAWLAGLGPIEPYAAYEPQRSCSPTVRAGTGVLRDTLLGTHPQTRNLGIVRACHIGGRSEHKEGRAFDWGAYVDRPVERAAVERFLTQLFATDAEGNTHALARRLGVMYVVWDGQIWASHRAREGWRHYHGPNPHVDHIHISLSWAGSLGRTSFFTQDLAGRGVLGLVPPGGTPLATDDAPVAAVPVAGQDLTPPSTGGTSTPGPGGTPGSTTSGNMSGGKSPGAPQESPSKGDAAKGGRRPDPSPRPAPSLSPEKPRVDHARREAEKEQRRIEEEQRRAEEKRRGADERARQRQQEQQRREEEKQARAEATQAERQAVAPQHDEPDSTSSGKGGSKGNGKGGSKGKR